MAVDYLVLDLAAATGNSGNYAAEEVAGTILLYDFNQIVVELFAVFFSPVIAALIHWYDISLVCTFHKVKQTCF